MLVPKLRFKEFSNEWKKIKLKHISTELQYGMNAAATDFDGQNKYIRITDIDDNTHLYNNNPVSPDGKLEEKFLVNTNDILFARTGASTGKTYLYSIEDGRLYFAGFLIRAHIKENNNSRFIFEQTNLSRYKNWLKLTSMRSGQPGINSAEYGNYEFSITNIDEENKIAHFFELLNKKIELQQRKIEVLKMYKKGLSDNIYASLKEKIIELNNYAIVQGGFAFKSELFQKKGKPIVRISNIYNNLVDLNDLVYYDSALEIDKKFYVNDSDLLIAMSGATTGKYGIYHNTYPAYLNQRVGKIICKKYTILYYPYLYFLFGLTAYEKQLQSRLIAGAQPNISPADIENMKFKFPNINTQKKIADMIINITKKISIENKKLDNLNILKQSLLQQMFI